MNVWPNIITHVEVDQYGVGYTVVCGTKFIGRAYCVAYRHACKVTERVQDEYIQMAKQKLTEHFEGIK